ncbi:hypothetical protein D9M68_565680 [compost metagenome]
MRAESIRGFGRPTGSVQFTGTCFSFVTGLVRSQAERQGVLVGEREGVRGAAEVLSPDLLGFAGIGHEDESVVELVGTPEKVDAVRFYAAVGG